MSELLEYLDVDVERCRKCGPEAIVIRVTDRTYVVWNKVERSLEPMINVSYKCAVCHRPLRRLD